MTAAAALALATAAAAAPPAPALSLQWMRCCFQSGVLCSRASGLCRAYAHFVAAAEAPPGAVLRGGANVTIDGGRPSAGTAMVREAKPGADPRTGAASQTINYGYDAVAPAGAAALPAEVCAAVWVDSPGQTAAGSLAQHCLALPTQWVNDSAQRGAPGAPMPMWFDAEHSQAVRAPAGANASRLLVHADVRVAAPHGVDVLSAGALCSVDGGEYRVCGAVYYEQQILLQDDGRWWQVLQWVHDAAAAGAPGRVCFKVWVFRRDDAAPALSWLGGGEGDEQCIDVTAA